MSTNTFIEPSVVVRDATLIYNDQLIIGNLVNRTIEGKFVPGIGKTVKVKAPPNFGDADEFTTTATAANLTETGVDVTISHHIYKQIEITADQQTFNLDDFTQQVTLPATRSLVRKTEKVFLEKLVGGFARNVSGTRGTSPSALADVFAAEKVIFDKQGDESQLISIISSTTHANLIGLNQFSSVDYGADAGALKTNSLGMMGKSLFFRTPHAGSFTRGYLTGTIVVDGTVASGTMIHIDGFTAATGTIYAGTSFVKAGDATVYTITEDATIAANEVDIYITPTLASAATDEDVITFQTAVTHNVMYNPQGIVAAIIPPPAQGANSATMNVNGLGLRVTFHEPDRTYLKPAWTFETYIGARVIMPDFGCVMQHV